MMQRQDQGEFRQIYYRHRAIGVKERREEGCVKAQVKHCFLTGATVYPQV